MVRGRQPTLFIGTHALIEQTFTVERLGLVIIDEQHKFGVAQREQLVKKGNYPHLLVMTATPIPRTLGLTLYGDLDISTIEQPPVTRGQDQNICAHGREPRKSLEVRAKRTGARTSGLRHLLATGRGRYGDWFESGHEGIRRTPKSIRSISCWPDAWAFEVGRKATTMQAFYANGLHVLLATSIVEVGLDVPNATVMVIENADQFGLAQLHQLRGRIGAARNNPTAYCWRARKLPKPKRD